MDKQKSCENGYHYHYGHSKSDKFGCMKDEDMKVEQTKTKESFGNFSIYNAIRCSSERRLNNISNYIGI